MTNQDFNAINMENRPHMTIKAANGIAFRVELVAPGAAYGRDNCLTNDSDETLVEFLDTRYFGGQFISRYYLSTLLEKTEGGLCLDGGIPDWSIDAKSYVVIDLWLRIYAQRNV